MSMFTFRRSQYFSMVFTFLFIFTVSFLAAQETGSVAGKLTDEKGGSAYVTMTDLKGSNGVIHVIDTVVMPG